MRGHGEGQVVSERRVGALIKRPAVKAPAAAQSKRRSAVKRPVVIRRLAPVDLRDTIHTTRGCYQALSRLE